MGSPADKFPKDTHSNDLWLKSLSKVEAMEYLTQFKLVSKISANICMEADSLMDNFIKIADERVLIVNFGEEHVLKRVLALRRDPILSTRVEQICTIATKYFTAEDSLQDFTKRFEKLRDSICNDETCKELKKNLDLETLKKMSIPNLKVVVGEWNKRLHVLRETKNLMEEFLADWDQRHPLQAYEECARLIDSLWVENRFAIY